MGDLQATIEFMVELYKFYNVDLFIRGNYQLRLTFKPPKCSHAIQVEMCDYQDTGGVFTLFPAFITRDGQTAASRTFNIYYKDEEVMLKDVFLFRVHLLIDSTKAADWIEKTTLEMNVDVHFTDQVLREHNFKHLPLVTSRTLQFHFSTFNGLHHQIPLLFDYYYFSVVDLIIHANILSLGLPDLSLLKLVKTGWFSKSTSPRSTSPLFFNTLFGNRQQLTSQFYSDAALKYAIPSSSITRESLEKASAIHRNLCVILAMAHSQLRKYFDEMMLHFDEKMKITLAPELDPADLVDNLCKKLEMLQSCEQVFDEMCSDLSVLSGELLLLWSQFKESFALNDNIRPILREQHHGERMLHFSEAFFVRELSWNSLLTTSAADSSAQKHTTMGQHVKSSRYLTLIPPVTVECAEVDGDCSTTPIFFEDRFVGIKERLSSDVTLSVPQSSALSEDEVLEHKPLGILNEAFSDCSTNKAECHAAAETGEEWVDVCVSAKGEQGTVVEEVTPEDNSGNDDEDGASNGGRGLIEDDRKEYVRGTIGDDDGPQGTMLEQEESMEDKEGDRGIIGEDDGSQGIILAQEESTLEDKECDRGIIVDNDGSQGTILTQEESTLEDKECDMGIIGDDDGSQGIVKAGEESTIMDKESGLLAVKQATRRQDNKYCGNIVHEARNVDNSTSNGFTTDNKIPLDDSDTDTVSVISRLSELKLTEDSADDSPTDLSSTAGETILVTSSHEISDSTVVNSANNDVTTSTSTVSIASASDLKEVVLVADSAIIACGKVAPVETKNVDPSPPSGAGDSMLPDTMIEPMAAASCVTAPKISGAHGSRSAELMPVDDVGSVVSSGDVVIPADDVGSVVSSSNVVIPADDVGSVVSSSNVVIPADDVGSVVSSRDVVIPADDVGSVVSSPDVVIPADDVGSVVSSPDVVIPADDVGSVVSSRDVVIPADDVVSVVSSRDVVIPADDVGSVVSSSNVVTPADDVVSVVSSRDVVIPADDVGSVVSSPDVVIPADDVGSVVSSRDVVIPADDVGSVVSSRDIVIPADDVGSVVSSRDIVIPADDVGSLVSSGDVVIPADDVGSVVSSRDVVIPADDVGSVVSSPDVVIPADDVGSVVSSSNVVIPADDVGSVVSSSNVVIPADDVGSVVSSPDVVIPADDVGSVVSSPDVVIPVDDVGSVVSSSNVVIPVDDVGSVVSSRDVVIPADDVGSVVSSPDVVIPADDVGSVVSSSNVVIPADDVGSVVSSSNVVIPADDVGSVVSSSNVVIPADDVGSVVSSSNVVIPVDDVGSVVSSRDVVIPADDVGSVVSSRDVVIPADDVGSVVSSSNVVIPADDVGSVVSSSNVVIPADDVGSADDLTSCSDGDKNSSHLPENTSKTTQNITNTHSETTSNSVLKSCEEENLYRNIGGKNNDSLQFTENSRTSQNIIHDADSQSTSDRTLKFNEAANSGGEDDRNNDSSLSSNNIATTTTAAQNITHNTNTESVTSNVLACYKDETSMNVNVSSAVTYVGSDKKPVAKVRYIPDTSCINTEQPSKEKSRNTNSGSSSNLQQCPDINATNDTEQASKTQQGMSYTLERRFQNSVFYDRSSWTTSHGRTTRNVTKPEPLDKPPEVATTTPQSTDDELSLHGGDITPYMVSSSGDQATCFCGGKLSKSGSPYQPSGELDKSNIKLSKAKQDVKARLNGCWSLYSDSDLEFTVRPYFIDPKPDLSNAPVHFVVCVHGLDGNSGDLRLLRCFLEMALPSTRFEFLMSEINQDNTFLPFDELTEKLVSEILHHMEAYRISPSRISFIGHSLGNIIIRSALTHPLLKPYVELFYTFLSLSGPHLGMIYHTSSLVSTGLWLMQKLKKSESLLQLSLNDSQDLRETFVYKLSTKKGLEYFTNVLLVSSVQDHYVPFHSSRIELPRSLQRSNSQESVVYREMIDNILTPLHSQPNRTLVRYSVYHCLPSSTNNFIGRAAHIAMLDSELFIEKLICRSAGKYFQ